MDCGHSVPCGSLDLIVLGIFLIEIEGPLLGTRLTKILEMATTAVHVAKQWMS